LPFVIDPAGLCSAPAASISDALSRAQNHTDSRRRPSKSGTGMAKKKTSKPTKAKKKDGQALGNKGNETRLRLMAAARRLMNKGSPLSLTAAAIAKEAGTAGATFYVYFDDVEDILFAMCDAIAQDTTSLFADDSILRVDERLEQDALAFVKAYVDIWTRHGPLLLYRNLESDRGNPRFYSLLLRISLPILKGLTDRIVEQSTPEKPITRGEANAEAVVLYAAMDRIAAALHQYPRDSLMPDVLLRAQARVLTRMLRRR
jgi:AcrR family transcriptional regulator